MRLPVAPPFVVIQFNFPMLWGADSIVTRQQLIWAGEKRYR
jgi:hypothetical protein